MDLYSIIDTLIAERNRIDRIIQSLDAGGAAGAGRRTAGKPARAGAKRPGRKSMDPQARQDVSERMKRYWARRRSADAAGTSEGAPDATSTAFHVNGAAGGQDRES